jgi:hypothetical protein
MPEMEDGWMDGFALKDGCDAKRSKRSKQQKQESHVGEFSTTSISIE